MLHHGAEQSRKPLGPMMLDTLRDELVKMDNQDQSIRDTLAAEGVLHDGYHPRMAAIHKANAQRLRDIIDEHGWPVERLVGPEGAKAAWRIAQHAIGEPEFQRECLRRLSAAAKSGDVPAWQPAMIEDRIRMFEGRPQLFGTQLEPDDQGIMRPYLIEDPGGVDERRRAVGLAPLAERLASAERWPVPADRARYELEYAEWLRRVGWRL